VRDLTRQISAHARAFRERRIEVALCNKPVSSYAQKLFLSTTEEPSALPTRLTYCDAPRSWTRVPAECVIEKYGKSRRADSNVHARFLVHSLLCESLVGRDCTSTSTEEQVQYSATMKRQSFTLECDSDCINIIASTRCASDYIFSSVDEFMNLSIYL